MGEIKMEKILESIYRDRIEQLGLFSSALIHEIQTPLIIIRGRAESLLRHNKKNTEQDLKEISRECEHLMHLLDTMLYLAVPEKLKSKKVNLKELVSDVVLFFEKTCFERGISLKTEIENNIELTTEPSRLKSILISFILNAIESFDEGQFVIKSILIHSSIENDKLVLVVSDTGSGIKEEDKKKLFNETFFSTKAHKKSSGLGLTMANKMAQDISAKIRFFSEHGKGSSFEVVLPTQDLLPNLPHS